MLCKLLAVVVALALTACAHNTTTIVVNRKLDGPKVVALDAPRLPWVVEIETRLREQGFQVLRWASQKRVREATSETRTEEFRQAAARYVLVVEGSAPLGIAGRCFGGGYNFEYLSVELVDAKTNETVISIQKSGYSENCPPLSGTIFGDISKSLAGLW